jgi:hypothetical protein
MKLFYALVYLIFVIKIIFIILSLTTLYLKVKNKTNTELYRKIFIGRSQIRFAFDCLMSILLIYVFYPKNVKIYLINRETALLFYIFGFLLLINADWDQFFHSSYIIQKIQTVL